MPRRSIDQGAKPFELRTGVGGLPTFGGMFRSGDPATIPPHKFHLLVNMRRTPGGLLTRPGLDLEFNTGVRECINGLTEDAGEQGGALMLYPGAEAGSNPATFRAVFPDSSVDYSEFAFALFGPASVTRGTDSPVLAYTTTPSYLGPTWLSRPFIFRGQAVQFAEVNRNGTPTVALLGIELASRSFLQASNCFRTSAGPALIPACPGTSGQATPPGNDPPLWPYQHPAGSVGVLTYFDNPFPTSDAWRPDAARKTADLVVDEILTIQERFDDRLTGTPGVNEVLYFVARQDVAGPITKRRLVRWDGAQQRTEFAAIPDNLRAGLSEQANGPYLGSGDLSGGPGDWAAYRSESGTWIVIGGAGWTIGGGVDDYLAPIFLPRALSWGGRGHLLTGGTYQCGALSVGDYVHCHPQVTTEFDARRSARSCSPLNSCELSQDPIPVDALVSGFRCYVIAFLFGSVPHLCVGRFTDPLVSETASGVRLSDAGGAPATPDVWIQAAGGRVYVGGKFIGWNPVTQAVDVTHHGVYDVTDPNQRFNVYRVTETQQTNDAVAERYSRGALPAVPNDDTGGEGFQAS